MKRYDSYKDSGVEWIGEIPGHWIKGKWGYYYNSGMGSTILKEDLVENGEIPVYSATEEDRIFGYINNPKLILNEGDIVIPARGNSIGHVKLISSKSTTSQTTIYSKSKDENLDSRFSYYYCKGNKTNLFPFVQTAIPQITVTEISFNPIIIPPLSEQQQIVSFLDTKTSLIDSLIEKTQRKIELLKEKRTSLINEVVTKGLNPNVEMKDSGVEWIGEIPSHWEYIPTKYFTINDKGVQTGPFGTQLNTKDYVESGVKVMNQKTLIDEDYDIGEEFISYEKYESLKVFEVIEGDIIMGTRGSFGTGKRTTFGKVSIVPSGLGDCVLHPCLIRIRLKENLMMKRYYYIYVNDSSYFLDDVKDTSNSTTIEVIYGVTLKDIKVPVPPIQEQQQIVEYLDEQTQLIDNTISIEEKRIELLKEYRQSLISEVVTGKRKVV